MNKVAVVLGVAAVAAFAGCRDLDYDAKHKPAPQDEAKQLEAEPASAPAEVTTVEVKEETSPAPVAKPAPVEPEYTVYIVQRGDYLAKISKKFNVRVDAIKSFNGLKNDQVRLGQKLKLPGKHEVGAQTVPDGAVAKPAKKVAKKYEPYSGATKEYVVKNGDSLGKIAYSNGMNIRQLKELNGLKSDNLKIGQKLKVADGVKKAAAPVAPAPAPAAVEPAPVAAEPVVEEKAVESEPAPAVEVKDVPAPEKAPETAPATTTYVVTEGDDMTHVAISFGVTASQIRELNNLAEGQQLKPGMVIKIPADAQ